MNKFDRPVRIGKYQNGNYTVYIYSNGTKIRYNKLDNLSPEFPESIDLKITDCCEQNCLYCHEQSSPTGKHADLDQLKFIETLRPFTELAIGGGNPLTHPQLLKFLDKCNQLQLIPNITVNYLSAIDYPIEQLKGKVYGFGLSVSPEVWESQKESVIAMLESMDNSVLHLILGVTPASIIKEAATCCDRILLLGYKTFGRGVGYGKQFATDIANNIKATEDWLVNEYLPETEYKATIGFDNLAVDQLHMHYLDEETCGHLYLGEDGFASMYVDGVKMQFAVSSTSTERFPLTDDIMTMFPKVHRTAAIYEKGGILIDPFDPAGTEQSQEAD